LSVPVIHVSLMLAGRLGPGLTGRDMEALCAR
jgi:hypothetical protein